MHVLIVGGTGNFGKRLTESLLKYHDCTITIVGRQLEKLKQTQRYFQTKTGKSVSYLPVDIFDQDLSTKIGELKPAIIVNASGPFTPQPDGSHYALARACLTLNAHYVDLSDNRQFVSKFNSTFHQEAIARGCMLISGASTVPGLSTAVIDHYAPQFSCITGIDYGISPGNKTERGQATVASILSYTGKPFMTRQSGGPHIIYGWQNLRLYNFGQPLGYRWLSNCDIPDLSLLPERYPTLKDVQFQAGLEVSVLHLGLWLFSAFSRIGVIKNWAKYAGMLTRASELFRHLGSDAGGMFVNLSGQDRNGQAKSIHWHLVAEKGVGPNIPTIAAELVIDLILSGQVTPGAHPCMGLFDLAGFMQIANRWGIYQYEAPR